MQQRNMKDKIIGIKKEKKLFIVFSKGTSANVLAVYPLENTTYCK